MKPTGKMKWADRLEPMITGTTRGLFGGKRVSGNGSFVHPRLNIEHWIAVSDGKHNLTTDMIHWRGEFYLVHSSSPWHTASSKSKLVVWKSKDARHWEKIKELSMPGGDIRDPKFGIIQGKLFLYILRNDGFVAEPSATAYTVTSDGISWSPVENCRPEGWIFWRPKSPDDKTWFMPAYWHKHGKSILLKSTDGKAWTEVSTIYEGEHNDETDIEFLADGRLLATARLEVSSNPPGDNAASTLIAVARPPYTEWSRVKSKVTRLDGPNLFSYDGVVYAAGRHHPDCDNFLNRRGSFLGRKRTALYEVTPAGLVHLSDFPSNGDTGYPGVVIQGDILYVCYYTNDIDEDYPWVVGMFLPSEICMAKSSLSQLAALRAAVTN